MAKLRRNLGRRLKFFRRGGGTGSKLAPVDECADGSEDAEDVTTEDVAASIGKDAAAAHTAPPLVTVSSNDGSAASNTSSLNSDVRCHGPIDIDTCRKSRGGGPSSGRGGGADVERPSTPTSSCDGNSNSNARSSTASQHSQLIADALEMFGAAGAGVGSVFGSAVGESSPGGMTTSTVDGRDVFERSRSALSQVLGAVVAPPSSSQAAAAAAAAAPNATTAAAEASESKTPSVVPGKEGAADAEPSNKALAEPPTEPPTVAPRAKSPPAVKPSSVPPAQPPAPTKQRSGAGGFLSSLPKIMKRDRSGTPSSVNTAALMEEAERELGHQAVPATPSSSKGRAGGQDQTPSASGNEVAKPSPSSVTVTHLFDSSGSSYPVEIDPVESLGSQSLDEDLNDRQEDRYKVQRPDRYEIKEGGQHRQGQDEQQPTLLVSPPKINRLSPAKMFSGKWGGGYTSLEDAGALLYSVAVSANNGDARDEGETKQTRSLEEDATAAGVGGLGNLLPWDPSPNSKKPAGAATRSSAASVTSTNSEAFLALKKDAEKNEFKRASILLGKKIAALPPPPSSGRSKAALLASMPSSSQESGVGSRGFVAQSLATPAAPVDPPGGVAKAPVDPPGAQVKSAPSVSPVPTRSESPSAFLDDLEKDSASQPPQQPHAAAGAGASSSASFSFEQDFLQHPVDDSLSDDGSCSYMSELESIGEITIDEETTRMIEAHKRYSEDARTNPSHPARRKRSIMRVGSVFKKEAAPRPRAVSLGSSESIKTEPVSVGASKSIETEQRKRLTWYDDEENWNKPFTLRTDESFDISTVTTDLGGGKGGSGVVRYNVVDQFLGDFIRKFGACGGEEDVASFDAAEQQEI